jgi:hypothetical protein
MISTGDDVAKLHRDVYTLVLGNVQYTKQLWTDEDAHKIEQTATFCTHICLEYLT